MSIYKTTGKLQATWTYVDSLGFFETYPSHQKATRIKDASHSPNKVKPQTSSHVALELPLQQVELQDPSAAFLTFLQEAEEEKSHGIKQASSGARKILLPPHTQS